MHHRERTTVRTVRLTALSVPVCAVLAVCGGALAVAEVPNETRPTSVASVHVRTSVQTPDLTDYDLSAGSEPAYALAGVGILTLGAGGAFAVYASRRR